MVSRTWGVTEFSEFLPSDVGTLIVIAPHRLQVRLADQYNYVTPTHPEVYLHVLH